MFTEYLQLIENVCINLFALLENDLAGNLFLSNFDLDEKIKSTFFEGRKPTQTNYNVKTSVDILKKYALRFQNKNKAQNVERIMEYYNSALKYSLIDYSAYKDFLNSYKHGFRFMSVGTGSLNFDISFEDRQIRRRHNYNTAVAYISKHDNEISEKFLIFDWQTTYLRMVLLISILQNALGIFLSPKSKLKIKAIVFKNKQVQSIHIPTAQLVKKLDDGSMFFQSAQLEV